MGSLSEEGRGHFRLKEENKNLPPPPPPPVFTKMNDSLRLEYYKGSALLSLRF